MAGVNKVILIGNLGRDPEVRTIESGAKVANFSLATTESYKNKEGNRIDQTEWHRIVLWRGLADIAERFLRKGSQVYIEGKIVSRKYTDKDNVERTVTEIIGDNMTLLGSRRDDIGIDTPSDEKDQYSEPPAMAEPQDDLPF
ncbi:MAG TPA: single-stranded DNA-binding protein [Bacteroidales bacterium]|jgi:single-strand DNA-binding protein|nr:single-stranded DNA-binding protein [Bacteroidales bacterium]